MSGAVVLEQRGGVRQASRPRRPPARRARERAGWKAGGAPGAWRPAGRRRRRAAQGAWTVAAGCSPGSAPPGCVSQHVVDEHFALQAGLGEGPVVVEP